MYVEVTFTSESLVKMLERFMQGSVGQPFLYHPGYVPIIPRDLDPELTGAMAEQFDIIKAKNPTEGSAKITFHNEPYLVNYVPSASLDGWYMVDFQPMKKVLAPIDHSKRMFYASGLLLLLMGIASAALLYRNVQKPINDLIRAVKSLRRGHMIIGSSSGPITSSII